MQAATLDDEAPDAFEASRRALAREIHDDVGGALAALNFDLAWIERHPGHAEAPARLRSAREALGQAMEAMQRVVRGLYPPDLSDGLVSALGLLAANAQRRLGLHVVVDAADPRLDALSRPMQLAAYRTVQEALTNAARHARCRVVSVTAACDAEAGSAWFEVRDDGLGLAVRADGAGAASLGASDDGRPPGAGFGLRGLVERARAVGGTLDIASRPGRGTTVRLVVPWHAMAGEPRESEQRKGACR